MKQVVNLREKNRTLRSWDPADVQLDKSGLEDRFVGIMDSALAELQALEREHDVHPSDMQKTDSLFVEIDELLEGRIGAAPSQGKLRGRVDEAILFRYPNEIPPGYLDVGKKVPLVAAGDYLLWREVLDRAVMLKPGARYVLLVTSDMKPDWWLMNEKGKPLRARPELVQEIYEEAGARLLLVSLADFMNGARTHLAVDISDETVEQLREATSDPERDYGDLRLSRKNVLYLFSMSILDFERLLRDLLFAMGYAAVSSSPSVESGIDFRVRDASGLVPSRVVVQAKRYRHIVGAQVVRELLGAMVYLEVDAGVIIATSQFSSSARAIAEGKSMRLIDGAELVYLLAEHLGIQAALGVDPDRSDE